MASVSHYQLDARRLLCPMPVIRTQNMINELQPGDILEVMCTDPGALHDIPTWCRINSHRVITATHDDDEILITIEVDGG
jgi:tRNA 2-thiouridine synthesizing protein A